MGGGKDRDANLATATKNLQRQNSALSNLSTSKQQSHLSRDAVWVILKFDGDLKKEGEEQVIRLGKHFQQNVYGEKSLLALHSTYRHRLEMRTADDGAQVATAAIFAKSLLNLKGSLQQTAAAYIHNNTSISTTNNQGGGGGGGGGAGGGGSGQQQQQGGHDSLVSSPIDGRNTLLGPPGGSSDTMIIPSITTPSGPQSSSSAVTSPPANMLSSPSFGDESTGTGTASGITKIGTMTTSHPGGAGVGGLPIPPPLPQRKSGGSTIGAETMSSPSSVGGVALGGVVNNSDKDIIPGGSSDARAVEATTAKSGTGSGRKTAELSKLLLTENRNALYKIVNSKNSSTEEVLNFFDNSIAQKAIKDLMHRFGSLYNAAVYVTELCQPKADAAEIFGGAASSVNIAAEIPEGGFVSDNNQNNSAGADVEENERHKQQQQQAKETENPSSSEFPQVYERWKNMKKKLLPPKNNRDRLLDLTVVPTLHWMLHYDLTYNVEALQSLFDEETLTQLRDIVPKLASVIIPQEFGLTIPAKVKIACLLLKVLTF